MSHSSEDELRHALGSGGKLADMVQTISGTNAAREERLGEPAADGLWFCGTRRRKEMGPQSSSCNTGWWYPQLG
jgi:hypothetical protein